MDGSGSQPCAVAGRGISDVDRSGSYTTVLNGEIRVLHVAMNVHVLRRIYAFYQRTLSYVTKNWKLEI
jgi:hypothetical protein